MVAGTVSIKKLPARGSFGLHLLQACTRNPAQAHSSIQARDGMAKSDSTTVKTAAPKPAAVAVPKAGVSLAYPDFDLENPEFPQAIKDKALMFV